MKDEYGMRRARWGLKCSRCKQSGHNKAHCKLPPPESSQPATAQATSATTATTQAATSHPATTQTATVVGNQRNSQVAQRNSQCTSAHRNTQGQGTYAHRNTQGTSASTSQNTKTRKRKQKDQPSLTQLESSKGKKKKVYARRDGATSTQQ